MQIKFIVMSSTKPIVAVVTVLVLIAGAAYLYTNTKTNPADATAAPAAPVVDTTQQAPADTSGGASTSTPVTSASPYKDGTYTATGSYQTPESVEQVTVTLTLKGGVVTDAAVTGSPRAPESRRFQNQFIANFKSFVIGKNIDTLSLSHVSGSSLTSAGFNNAVAKIKAQAQA